MALKINDNGIDRDMTAEEEALFILSKNNYKTEKQAETDAQTAKQIAREAVLDKLGLTADEAAALLG